MVSIINHIAMTDTAVVDKLPPREEILEDGEIDDEEAITGVEETVLEPHNKQDDGSAVTHPVSHMDSHRDAADEELDSDEEKKRLHRKRQRKRKKHRDSKERELKRHKKRKLHSADDTEAAHYHGGSLSPHSKRHKKRKKHSRDRRDRDSTTPDSDESAESYPTNYYDSSRRAYDSYTMAQMEGAYNINNSSSAYYTSAVRVEATQQDSNNNDSESGSDFEAQLAEYQNYKTLGDPYSMYSSKSRGKRKEKKASADGEPLGPKHAEMYEEFMEYDENPKKLCKFFAEGKCLKGSSCSFSHDQSSRRNRGRSGKREMCKYYLAGHCHHGNQCTYMHGEYPCKYFHTGATCFAGDNCRFSHGLATEETRDIIESFKDILSNVDDTWEINELKKQGIKVKSKPPPGKGLLRTPDMHPLTTTPSRLHADGGSAIPSIFDINVAPTADFQKRIKENSVASLSMTDDSEETSELVGNQLPPKMYQPPLSRMVLKANGAGLLPSPASLPIYDAMAEQAQRGRESDDFYDNFYEAGHAMESADSQENSEGRPKAVGTSDDDIIKTDDEFIRIDNSNADEEETKAKNPDDWAYSSDEEESQDADSGVIKMDVDAASSSTETPQSGSATVESLLKIIRKGGNPANVDTNLLSKVASVINMPTSMVSSTYSPASSVATYNPAQSKTSPLHPSTHQKERKAGGSTSASPGHPQKHRKPHPSRVRLPTQELTREPVVIPLVAKQSNNPAMHSSHPDPRLTLSSLLGVKATRFIANPPRFSKDLILPGAGKVIGLQVTLSSEDSKVSKRDPRLGRRKDPRLQRFTDPRLGDRGILKSSTTAMTTDSKSSVPSKPPALLTKSSTAIPSLPELDLNLAIISQHSSKENGDAYNAASSAPPPPYSMPNLKLPRLVKAPLSQDSTSIAPIKSGTRASPPPIAPYDPRFMASGSTKQKGASDLLVNAAPYDPRVLSGKLSSLPAGMELKKRTIQLPKLTPAPTYKPSSDLMGEKPEGDQGDF